MNNNDKSIPNIAYFDEFSFCKESYFHKFDNEQHPEGGDEYLHDKLKKQQ